MAERERKVNVHAETAATIVLLEKVVINHVEIVLKPTDSVVIVNQGEMVRITVNEDPSETITTITSKEETTITTPIVEL